MNQQMQAILSV